MARKMKKTILVSIAILAVLSAFVIFPEYKRYFGEQLLFKIVVLAVGLLPGILLALITLIPAIRKRARSDLAGRVATLLAVMMLSVGGMFLVIKWLEVQVHYAFAFLSFMDLGPHPYYLSYGELEKFDTKYETKREAVDLETWIRAMVPPLLRWQCYTIEKDVCEFVDRFPHNRELINPSRYLQGVALALGFSLPGGALAWHLTHKKRSHEMVTED